MTLQRLVVPGELTQPKSQPNQTSRLPQFFTKTRQEKIDTLQRFASLSLRDQETLLKDGALSFDLADLLIENSVGSFSLPLGIATNFKINQRDYVIPMAVEESSLIAAASNAAKTVYFSGGFEAEELSSLMIGQIQVLDLKPSDFPQALANIQAAKSELLFKANAIHPRLIERGGGARDIEIQLYPDAEIPFIVLHLLVDCCEAMGANLINTACEGLAPELEKLTGGRVALRILSNLCDRSVYRARCRVPADQIPSAEARRIVEAGIFAETDPHRAATHNKGILNGVDPIVIATGNDWRAVEAGAHAFAARSGRYTSLSRWWQEGEDLCGELTLPLQLGTVGGVTRLHPTAEVVLKILRSPSASDLGKIIVSSGLAVNLSALRALATTGIQQGHMKLHAKNLAYAAGARGNELDYVTGKLLENRTVTASAAGAFLRQVRQAQSPS